MTENNFQSDENIQSFLSEAHEMIEEVEPYLIEITQSSSEQGDTDPDTLNLIFRLFHSIKGTAGFLQFDEVVRVTHEAETLLYLIREGQIKVTPENTDVLCRTCDIVSSLLSQIEFSGTDSGLESETQLIINELELSQTKTHDDEKTLSSNTKEAANGEQKIEAADDSIKEKDTSEMVEKLLLSPEMIRRFIEEAIEQLELVEESLLKLKEDPEKTGYIKEAFRSLHNFKGNCGFSGYTDLEKVAHKTETVMEAIKEGKLKPDDPTIQTLLHMIDVFSQAVNDISKKGKGEIDNTALLLDFLEDILPENDEEIEADLEDRPEIKEPEALYLLRGKSAIPNSQEKTSKKPMKKQCRQKNHPNF